jgi:type III restriction enzyme
LGKIGDNEQRNFATSDLKIFEDLFIPEHLKEEIFSFVQSSVVTKEQIGKKITGNGQIILTNWHIFMERNKQQEQEEDFDPLANPERIIKDLFPLRP